MITLDDEQAHLIRERIEILQELNKAQEELIKLLNSQLTDAEYRENLQKEIISRQDRMIDMNKELILKLQRDVLNVLR
jgi:hypothetical protein